MPQPLVFLGAEVTEGCNAARTKAGWQLKVYLNQSLPYTAHAKLVRTALLGEGGTTEGEDQPLLAGNTATMWYPSLDEARSAEDRVKALSAKCPKCNGDFTFTTVYDSVWDGPFPCSGSGNTRARTVAYCPHCELEPRAGIVQSSLYEELARAMS